MAGRSPRPVRLLGSQALMLGLTSGLTIIPASGIFLDAYGAGALAWVYLVVAAVGAALVPVLNRALARRSLAAVSTGCLVVVVAVLAVSWLGLEATGDAWISFPLQVVFPTFLQIGFVLIGGQAGRLLTVRELKERFARIASGFVLGFFASGVVAAPLLSVLGETHRLLAFATASALGMLALIRVTAAAYPAELRSVPEPAGGPTERSTMSTRRLLGRPLVASLLAYQFLSALGTQLVDYLVYDRAAARYSTSRELARFTSMFTVVLNVVALVFVALVAGRLLRRFGMRAGLVMNPAVVLLLVVAAVAAAATTGVGALGVFVLVGAARVLDISLTDGATRGSINTAYQALPSADRLNAQAMVEGIGQPAALGITGGLLLVLDHVLDAGPTTVLVVTAVIGGVWTYSGIDSYRRYRAALHDALRTRVLRPSGPEGDPEDSSLDAAGLERLEGLLDDPGATRSSVAGLLRVARGHDPELATLLLRHLAHPSRPVGLEVMRTAARVGGADPAARLDAVEAMLAIDAADAARVSAALVALQADSRPIVGHVRDALQDERRLLRDRTVAALGLVSDPATSARAGSWLDSGDARLVAAAIESVEVIVPARLRARAVALCLDAGEPVEQLRALGVAPAAASIDAVLAETAARSDDEAHRWTATCARHAMAPTPIVSAAGVPCDEPAEAAHNA